MPTNDEIEAAIAADPYDLAGYRVYADWLEGHGDPRAELIRAMCGDANPNAVRKLIKRHAMHLYGPLEKFQVDNYGEQTLRWKFGFIHAATIHRGVVDVHRALAHLLEHPSGRLLVELSLSDLDLAPALATLCTRAPRSLRKLELSNTSSSAVDLAALWSAVPHLAHLVLDGPLELGTLALPDVHTLHLRFQRSASALETIRAAPWPKLSRLHLLVDERATFADYEPLFTPTLEHVEVTGALFADEVCRVLPQTLRTLVVNGLTDAGALALAGMRERFANLETCEVTNSTSYQRRLSADAIAALQAVGIDVWGADWYDEAEE
jgi:uncharacterized protein (TIGR02996 family)